MGTYLKNFVAGLILGSIFFLGPVLLGRGGVLGFSTLSRVMPIITTKIYIAAIVYLFFFCIVFTIYRRFISFNGPTLSFFSALTVFLAGVVVSFCVFLVIAMWAISQLGF